MAFLDLHTPNDVYFLGVCASDKVNLTQTDDMNAIALFKTLGVPEKAGNGEAVTCDESFINEILQHLNCTPSTKLTKCTFPELPQDYLMWEFIRGLFDMSGTISYSGTTPLVQLFSSSPSLIQKVSDYSELPNELTDTSVTFNGTNAIDFLGRVYDGEFPESPKYLSYLNLLGLKGNMPQLLVFRTDDRAVLPTKARMSDVGYDLTIIKEFKKLTGNCTLYDTGIVVKPEYGYYTEIVPRSSLSKSGYILANSIGIIEQSYSGKLLVALIKVDKDSPDIELPYKCCQLIVRKQEYSQVQEVGTMFDITDRGSGGFGSTNK
jgi:dUTP pyrophosphatase